MNILSRDFGFGMALILLAGCSTAPFQPVGQVRVPAQRRFAASALLQPSSRRSCALTIAREEGVSARGLNVFLDGERIARLAAGESIRIYANPGHHYVGVKPLFSPEAGRACALSKGESASLRIVDLNGNYELEPAQGVLLYALEHSVHSLLQ